MAVDVCRRKGKRIRSQRKERCFDTDILSDQERTGEARPSGIDRQATENIRSVVEAANQSGNQKKWTIYAPASEWLRGVARDAGLTLDGFDHGIDADAVRHAKNRHGDAELESRRGQISITDKDIESFPQVVGEPDRLVFGIQSKSNRLDAIGYVKRLDDGTIAHVDEVRTGRNRNAAVSMRKYPAAMDVDKIAADLHQNVRDDGGRTPVIVIRGPSTLASLARSFRISSAARRSLASGFSKRWRTHSA